MGQHDLSYRLFFAHRRMIQDLLREIVAEQWVERIDLGSGECVDVSFVSPRHENRESDVIWRFQRKDTGDPVYIYILVELHWWPDPSMPIRLMAYESLLHQRLIASQPTTGLRKPPLIISVVASLIDEIDPSSKPSLSKFRCWLVDEAHYPREKLAAPLTPMADLRRIEESRDWWEVRWNLLRLRRSIQPSDISLRRALETWLQKTILPRFGLSEENISATLTLEVIEAMLTEKMGNLAI